MRTNRVRALLARSAYGALDAATLRRGIPRTIDGETIRFPARWCRYYSSKNDPEKQEFLRRHCRRGSVAIDIGAHIGLQTVAMARAVGPDGRVISFEPTPTTCEVLAKTVELNGCSPIVEIRCEAVSRSSGTARLYGVAEPGLNTNSLVPQGDDIGEVRLVALDDIPRAIGDDVSCIKIDAEGAELDILRGADELVRRLRPAMAIEVHPVTMARAGERADAVWDWLSEREMVVQQGGRTIPRETIEMAAGPFEIQAIPQEGLLVRS